MMNNREQLIAFVFVTFMILGSVHVADWTNSAEPDLIQSSELSTIIIEEMLPDPGFDQQPDAVINGSSGEFSTGYQPATDESNSYVELNWSHTPNTALEFVGVDPDGNLPDYNDFVYVYQEFDWPYEKSPEVVEFRFNYSSYLTGDFTNISAAGNLMFRVYVWAIDSSNNWVRIYESREATYTEQYRTKLARPGYFEVKDIFDGMVEVDGVQEDPEDTVKLAIGIAPTFRFENYSSTEPWTYFDGSVSIRVDSANFFIDMFVPTDPASIWQPVHNETYGTNIREIYPTSPYASIEVQNECYGMVTGTDGSIYVTGITRLSNEFVIEDDFHHQFLLKYSPSLELLWSVNNENSSEVRSISYHNGFIYTTGYNITGNGRDLIVTKWTTDGVKVWQSEWGEDYDQVGIGVGVHEDGSVYVVATDSDLESFTGNDNSSVLKFDNDGNLLWSKSITLPLTSGDHIGNLYVEEACIYFAIAGSVSCINLEGEYLYGRNSFAVTPDGVGGLFIANQEPILSEYETSHLVLSQIDSTGYELWNSTYRRTWPNGLNYQYRPIDMVLSPENTLLILVYNSRHIFDYTLLTFDLDGTLLRNRTIGEVPGFTEEYWPQMSEGPVFMDVGISGLGYFAFSIPSGAIDVNVQAYEVYQVSDDVQVPIETIVAIAGGVGVIALVGVIVFKKKRT